MPGSRRPSPAEAFAHHIEDAKQLVNLANALTNTRTRRMRAELRERLGDALGIPIRHWDELECIDSTDVFLIFRPGSAMRPSDLVDLRALLRQAVVAACAAFETYLGDKVIERVGPLLQNLDSLTRRLGEIPLTLSQWMLIETTYQRHGAGLRNQVVRPYVREKASAAPSNVGELLSMIGIKDWAAKVDRRRGVQQGETVEFLDRIRKRRNKIAHEADRQGRGRADLAPAEVEEDLETLTSVVGAIEWLIGPTAPPVDAHMESNA